MFNINKLLNLKKNSDYWYKLYKKDCNIRIIDPDGWDRENFEKSWFIEEITWDTFIKRVMNSSIITLKDK